MDQNCGGRWPGVPSAPPADAVMAGGAAPPYYSPQVQHPPIPPASSVPCPQSHTDNPYVKPIPAPNFTGGSPIDMFNRAVNRLGKKFDKTTRKVQSSTTGIWGHLRTSSDLVNAATGRLVHGTKVLMEGGQEQLFFEAFRSLPDEQLQKGFACHLSHSTGPVAGTFYLSTARLAFASDHPVCSTPCPGYVQQPVHYRVDVPLEKLFSVKPSSNSFQPAEKYIQIITKEGNGFWFMGFVSYDKALQNLTEALKRSVPLRN